MSILPDVKKMVGLTEDYTAFDIDILIYINAAFSTLNQLGLGPEEGFEVEDDTAEWVDFIGTDARFAGVKTYVYLRTRMLFDPPTTSYLINASTEQIKELEWRLNTVRETDGVSGSSSIDGGTI